jgi:hypothetical protein
LAFSYWTDKPWFLTEGKLLMCSSYLSLGVPNWSVIYISTPSASVVLEMPEDDNMSIILGRPFLNTVGAVIDSTKGKSLLMLMIKSTRYMFPRRLIENML